MHTVKNKCFIAIEILYTLKRVNIHKVTKNNHYSDEDEGICQR
jgi:hypothetical protein